MPTKDVALVWPKRGISERFAFSAQPPETARDGGNVVGMEPGTDRIRGGTRPGHLKYINAQVNGSAPVLDLASVVGDDRQLTYALQGAPTYEWRKPTAANESGVAYEPFDVAVDFSGRVYVIDSDSSFSVFSPGGEVQARAQVPILPQTKLNRIQVDEFFNVYLATGGNFQDDVNFNQANSRIFKYRTIADGSYVLDWELTPKMQTVGLTAGSAIGTVAWATQMLLKGSDLWVAIADFATPVAPATEGELHKYENVFSSDPPSTPALFYGITAPGFGIAVRGDGVAFVGACVRNAAVENDTLTKYSATGTVIWTDSSAGHGAAVVLDSKDNLFTVGFDPATDWIHHWIDEGTTVRLDWSLAAPSAPEALAARYIRIAVDASDNVYAPWPDPADNVALIVASATGTQLFQWPNSPSNTYSIGVAIPPTTPAYSPSSVTAKEFVYVLLAGTQFASISSSTNASPIVLTVGTNLTAHVFVGDPVLVASHLVNTNANGRQTVQAITATTITLQGTTGNGVGGATGTVTALSNLVKLKLVAATPTSGSVRTAKVLAVAGGAIKVADLVGIQWDDPVGGGSTSLVPALSATSEYISSVDLFRQVFFTDGISYVVYDLKTDKVSPYVALKGTIEPRGKLITAWNGRLVVARTADDPHGWFMSRSGDPYDFDYFPLSGEVDPLSACAGTNTDAGRIQDTINGLIPWNDQLLFFMGDHTIWRLTGDPMDNGRIDNVSKTVGMAFGSAWCRDPLGRMYFFSTEAGVYRMGPGGDLERISVEWIERRLRDIDLTARFAKLAWNYAREGLEVWLCARGSAGSVSEHYFWEQLTGAWWPVSFTSANHEPRSVLVLDGDDPEDRVRILGCHDGYVRVQTEGRDDDGQPIESFIFLGPFGVQGDQDLRCLMGQLTLANDLPGGLFWRLYASDRPDVIGVAVAQGFVGPGRSPNIYGMRGRGRYFYLELRNAQAGASWAFENGLLRFASAGRSRATA